MTYTTPGNFDSQIFNSTFFAQAYNFGPDHTSRAAKYQNCWDFYDGRHWSQKAPEGFDQVTVNYAKAFVRKLRRFAFRNGWTMVFSEEQKADGIDKWVVDVWKHNDIVDITNKIGDFGGIFGDWYLYTQWLPVEGSKLPKSHQLKLSVLDPRYVYPQYNAKSGEMEYCVIIIPYEKATLKGNTMELESRLHREIHTKDKIYVQELNDHEDVEEEQVLDNPLGKMLIKHGVHQPKAGSFFGSGLVEDIIDISKLFNEKASDISDILDYHAAPITIIYGAKARQLEKGANKIWSGLPANAKVENLKSEGNIDAANTFLSNAKTWMHELSGIPEKALGGERQISNTSAVALSIDLEPLIELADDIRFYFDKTIQEVNEIIIDMGIYADEIKTSLEAPELYHLNIEHGSLLPRDRALDLNEIVTEMGQGLESRKGALVRLGVKNVDAKLAEIDKDKEEKSKQAFDLQAKYPTFIPNPIGNAATPTEDANTKKATKTSNNNPNVHGEQVSNAAKKSKS